MSTNREKLVKFLTKDRKDKKLVDVKFSFGRDSLTSENDFCLVVHDALDQIDSGQLDAATIQEIDGNFKTRSIQEFRS